MSTEANKALVRRFYEELFNQRNLAVADELLSPDYVLHHAGIPRPVRGPEAFQKMMARGLATMPDVQMTVEQLVAEGEYVSAWFTAVGTHGGVAMGIAPTGRSVTVLGSAIFRIVDGKVVEERRIEDTLGLLQQLGASITPPAPLAGRVTASPAQDSFGWLGQAGQGGGGATWSGPRAEATAMATYVLVHGAWHGGWCWTKVVPLLERAGHIAVAPDMPGHGADPTPIGAVTLQDYADRVCQVARAQGEPVILVGHSMGGAVISQAAEQCPEAVQLLVYLTAYLLPSGHTIVSARDPASATLQYQRLNEAEGSLTVAEEGLVPAFYHDCSAADVAFAKARLVPQALAPATTPLQLTDANYGRLPRVYIECLQDKTIPPGRQRQMSTAMPCAKVLTLDTSHSPFFSAPEQLAAHLRSLA